LPRRAGRTGARAVIGVVVIRRRLLVVPLAHLGLRQQELAIGGTRPLLGNHFFRRRRSRGVIAAREGGIALLHRQFWRPRRRAGQRRGCGRRAAQRARRRRLHPRRRVGAAALVLHCEIHVGDLLVEILGLALLLIGQLVDLAGQLPHLVLQRGDPVQQLRRQPVGRTRIAARCAGPRRATLILLQRLHVPAHIQNLILELDGLAALHLRMRRGAAKRYCQDRQNPKPHRRLPDHGAASTAARSSGKQQKAGALADAG
jgi:hypothetical protein